MAVEMICPDCGGMIGGNPSDPHPRCRCFGEPAAASVTSHPVAVDDTPPPRDGPRGDASALDTPSEPIESATVSASDAEEQQKAMRAAAVMASMKAQLKLAGVNHVDDLLSEDLGDLSGGGGDAANDTHTTDSPAAKGKICVQCGIDVNGKKRAKDSRGYWCYDCYKADKRKQRGEERDMSRCPNCGRKVPTASLTPYNGIPMCIKCRNEESDPRTRRFKAKVGDKHYSREERRNLLILAGVVVFLFLIIVMAHFHLLPKIF